MLLARFANLPDDLGLSCIELPNRGAAGAVKSPVLSVPMWIAVLARTIRLITPPFI